MATIAWVAMTLSGLAHAEPTIDIETITADSRDEAITYWFDFLGNINSSGMIEPAGSHGSLGLTVAAGGSAHRLPNQEPGTSNDAITASALDRQPDESSPFYMPRAWVLKGLPWSVDLGIAGGTPASNEFRQAAAFVQWTAYEDFAMPAISLRGGQSRIFGLPGTTMTSTSLEALASYGFLRYFTVYGSLGSTLHAAKISVRADDELAFLLQESEETVSTSRTWIARSRTGGLKVAVLPPFVALTGELRTADDGNRSYALKLSMGM